MDLIVANRRGFFMGKTGHINDISGLMQAEAENCTNHFLVDLSLYVIIAHRFVTNTQCVHFTKNVHKAIFCFLQVKQKIALNGLTNIPYNPIAKRGHTTLVNVCKV